MALQTVLESESPKYQQMLPQARPVVPSLERGENLAKKKKKKGIDLEHFFLAIFLEKSIRLTRAGGQCRMTPAFSVFFMVTFGHN